MVHRPSKQLFEHVHEGTESSMCVVESERQEIETGLYYSAFMKQGHNSVHPWIIKYAIENMNRCSLDCSHE